MESLSMMAHPNFLDIFNLHNVFPEAVFDLISKHQWLTARVGNVARGETSLFSGGKKATHTSYSLHTELA